MNDNFAVQVITSGSFIDQPSGSGKVYIVETAIVRLNPAALKSWYKAIVNDWDCFDLDTDEEYKTYLDEKRGLMMEFEQNIAQAVKFRPAAGVEKINVSQIVSEVFAVAWIHEIKI